MYKYFLSKARILSISVALVPLFLSIFSTIILAIEKELEPHYVIIESSFEKDTDLPIVTEHSYDLQKPTAFKEPYYPDIKLSTPLLFENFPQLTEISQMTKSLGSFSEYFIDDQGVLENAIILARKGEYEEASNKLYELRVESMEYQEIAALWLAWIKYKEKNWVQSTDYSASLHNARDQQILKEAYYLSSLLLIQNERYGELRILLEELLGKIDQNKIGFRLSYLYLLSLIQTEKWQLARKFIDQLKQKQIKHVPQYYNLEEMDGIIAYYENDTNISLARYQLAYHYNIDPIYRQFIRRNMAWILYFDQKYNQAVDLIDVELSGFRKSNIQELKYLKVSSLVANNQWEKVEELLPSIDEKSIFYQFSAYKVAVNLPDGPKYDVIRQKVKETKPEFEEMKFHFKILNGNQYFLDENYRDAAAEYLQAIDGHSKNRTIWLGSYNLGLVFLKTNQFKKAEEIFESLLSNIEAKKTKWIYYHLLYAYYQQKRMKPILNLFYSEESLGQVDTPEWEWRLMFGGALQSQGENDGALKEYFLGWEKQSKIQFLEYALSLQYKIGHYEKVIEFQQNNKGLKTGKLFGLKVKSMLGMKQNKQALEEIETQGFVDDEQINLRLEVWLANQLNQKIIAEVLPLLANATDDEKRLLYYLSLGDAYFNLKDYTKSKIQFYKALNLAISREQKSLILYNIVLTTYFYKDYPSFLKETNLALEKSDLTDSIRYVLTQLYVDYLFEVNDLKGIDEALGGYIRKYSYQRAKANLKYLSILVRTNRYVQCYNLAKIAMEEETDFQHRDRAIFAIDCAKQSNDPEGAIILAEKEMGKLDFDYRKNELALLLAETLYNTEEYKDSLKILESVRDGELSKNLEQQINILIAKNHLRLDQPNEAKQELGDVSQYRSTQQYIEAIKVQGEVLIFMDDPETAIRSFIRIYYHPTTRERDKMEMLIQIVRLYLELGKVADANLYFDKIDRNVIAKYSSLKVKYDEMGKNF